MKYKYLYCDQIVKNRDSKWFSAFSHNGIYQLNEALDRAVLVARIPNENILGLRLYRSAVSYKDKIIFPPCNAKEIAIFDVLNHKVEKLPLKPLCAINKLSKFWESFLYGKYAYFIGATYPAIVCMDLETKDLLYFTDGVNRVKSKSMDYVFLSGYILRGRYAYCTYVYEDSILKIDLENNQFEIIDIGSGAKGFYAMTDDGEDVWLVPIMGCDLVKWNPDTGRNEKIRIPMSKDGVRIPFHAPLIDNDKIYLLPFEQREAFIVDKKTNYVNKYDALTKTFKTDVMNSVNKEAMYHARLIQHRKIAYIDGDDYKWHIYDTSAQEDFSYHVALENNDREFLMAEIIKRKFESCAIIGENEDYTLNFFLYSILMKEPFR